jgi:hypothetical protein
VVGHISPGFLTVADAVSEHAAARVGYVDGVHVESFDFVTAHLNALERPLARELAGTDGKVRRRDGAGQDLLRITLLGHDHPNLGRRVVGGRAEGNPVGVIPVKVSQQQGALEHAILTMGCQAL